MAVLTLIECDKCEKRLENRAYKFLPFKEMCKWAAEAHQWYTTRKPIYGKHYNFCSDCIEERHEFKNFNDFIYSVNLKNSIACNKALIESGDKEDMRAFIDATDSLERKLEKLKAGKLSSSLAH